MAVHQQAAAEAFVDLEHFPLLDEDQRTRIVSEGRRGLSASGAAVLPDFLQADAVRAMAIEAEALLPIAHRRNRMLNAYARTPEPWMDADHPVRRTEHGWHYPYSVSG